MKTIVNRQYSEVEIKTANKGKLIVLLYRGAIKHLNKAVLQLEQKDMEGKGNSLIRAQDIVLELLYSIDQDMLNEGNELAHNLQRLYLYCYRRLVRANVHMDAATIEEVIALLANLLEAWEKVTAGDVADADAASEAGASAGLALTG